MGLTIHIRRAGRTNHGAVARPDVARQAGKALRRENMTNTNQGPQTARAFFFAAPAPPSPMEGRGCHRPRTIQSRRMRCSRPRAAFLAPYATRLPRERHGKSRSPGLLPWPPPHGRYFRRKIEITGDGRSETVPTVATARKPKMTLVFEKFSSLAHIWRTVWRTNKKGQSVQGSDLAF